MYSGTRDVPVIFMILCLTVWYQVAVAQDNPCARECVLDESPMQCNYTFLVENYRTMTKGCYFCPTTEEDCSREDCVPADGVHRDIITINRILPGPKIEVCVGDTVNVALTNSMFDQSTTIHWHGLHQTTTPYMDGVPFITQCPILPLSTFTYRFPVEEPGTYFYHSHIALQRGDGMFGALVVRQPLELDPHASLYDQDLSDHIVIVNDWYSVGGAQAFLTQIHSGGGGNATAMLVNGKGRLEEFTADDGSTIYTPVERFYVQSQQRYRFRFISNGILSCPVKVSVDSHTITVISVDGFDIEPVEADSFVFYPGERYDVVLNANQVEDVYWMRFFGLEECTANRVHQVAVLHYEGATEDAYPTASTDYEDSNRDGLVVNSANVGQESTDEDNLTVADLRAVEDLDPRLLETPDIQYIVPLSENNLDNPVFHKPGLYGYYEAAWGQLVTPQIAFSSMVLLPYPLLSQRDSIPANTFCNVSTISESCQEEFCACTHVAEIPLDSTVELIFFDTFATTNHPIHIHGLSFRVMGMQVVEEALTADVIREMDTNGELIRNFDNPPLKDTIQIPGGGYVIVRFLATNPGYWFLHCHIETHTTGLMSMVLKFGEHEEMLPIPTNFPTCGDYDPLNP